jgi:hypothetical protein
MIHWKCTVCHHEWDGEAQHCDWCGASGESLGKDAQWEQFWAGQVVEYADMTDEQKRIVDAGNEIAGTFPTGLTREELIAWMKERFGV